MIWFFQAAHDIMEKHDLPDDGDGPRHFEYGLGLMIGKVLELIDAARGMASAEKACDCIIAHAENWKKFRHVKLSIHKQPETS